jgi:U4/U6.U5 tri-snRNP-associated protein 3
LPSIESPSFAGGDGSIEVSEEGGRLEGGDESDDVQAQMRTIMGFKDFGTTKQKKVPGNNIYGVRKDKKTEYRQYMYIPLFILDICGIRMG